MIIFLDDGSDVEHVDRSTLPLAAKTGDLVSNVIGPLAYTYEAFKVQPVDADAILGSGGAAGIGPRRTRRDQHRDVQCGEPVRHLQPAPSSPERPDLQGYTLRLEKLAATIEAQGLPRCSGSRKRRNIAILEDLSRCWSYGGLAGMSPC